MSYTKYPVSCISLVVLEFTLNLFKPVGMNTVFPSTPLRTAAPDEGDIHATGFYTDSKSTHDMRAAPPHTLTHTLGTSSCRQLPVLAGRAVSLMLLLMLLQLFLVGVVIVGIIIVRVDLPAPNHPDLVRGLDTPLHVGTCRRWNQ